MDQAESRLGGELLAPRGDRIGVTIDRQQPVARAESLQEPRAVSAASEGRIDEQRVAGRSPRGRERCNDLLDKHRLVLIQLPVPRGRGI